MLYKLNVHYDCNFTLESTVTLTYRFSVVYICVVDESSDESDAEEAEDNHEANNRDYVSLCRWSA